MLEILGIFLFIVFALPLGTLAFLMIVGVIMQMSQGMDELNKPSDSSIPAKDL